MKIYTKTGDRGKTSLVGGQRVSKCCDRLESYGTIDELNSFIGMLIAECPSDEDRTFLTDQQSILFVVGGYLATDTAENNVRPGTIVTEEMISKVEQEIDRIDALLPPLRSFILPGGTKAASAAHVCRTICRRAERCIYRLHESGCDIDSRVTSYINRLSDYFFILARKLNADAKVDDISWTSNKERQ